VIKINNKVKRDEVDIQNNNLTSVTNSHLLLKKKARQEVLPNRVKVAQVQTKKKKKQHDVDESSLMSISESRKPQLPLFKTFKNTDLDDSECYNDMKKMMRLMKNRLSARKCRQKKKNYVNVIEKELQDTKDELDKYKRMYKREKQIENLMNLVKLFF
jgi:hypothetical protein